MRTSTDWLLPVFLTDAQSLANKMDESQLRIVSGGRTAHCTPDWEYLAVKCKPIKMVGDSCFIPLAAVNLLLHANTKLALEKLYRLINR